MKKKWQRMNETQRKNRVTNDIVKSIDYARKEVAKTIPCFIYHGDESIRSVRIEDQDRVDEMISHYINKYIDKRAALCGVTLAEYFKYAPQQVTDEARIVEGLY